MGPTAWAAPTATEPAIRSITVRPADPVVGPEGSVRLVIDVIARGTHGKNGVSVEVEPGAPPATVLADKPPVPDAGQQEPVSPSVKQPVQQPVQQQVQPPTYTPAQVPGHPQTHVVAPGRTQPQPHVLAQGRRRVPGSATVQTPASAIQAPAVQSAGSTNVQAPGAAVQPAGSTALQAPAVRKRPRQAGLLPVNPQSATTYDWQGQVSQPAPASAATDVHAHPQVPPHMAGRMRAAQATDQWQTWRFLPDKRLNRYYPAGIWTVTATAKGADGTTVKEYASFELRRETKLSSVRAEKSARSDDARLFGSLTRVDPRGLTDYGPFAKQDLEILWRPDTSSTWEKVGSTTTDAAGAFSVSVKGRTDGYWRVRYPGTTHYAADASKSKQIA